MVQMSSCCLMLSWAAIKHALGFVQVNYEADIKYMQRWPPEDLRVSPSSSLSKCLFVRVNTPELAQAPLHPWSL